MKILNQNKEDRILGIDLGSASIKIIEVKKNGQIPQLVTYGLAIREHSELTDPQEQLVTELRNTMSQARTISTNAVGAVPAASVFSTIVDFPQMPEKEIKSAIKWEAKKILPMPLEKMSLNWHVLPSMSENKNVIKIIFSAAPKDTITNFMDIFNKAGLRLISLETEIKALQRSLLSPDDDISMIVDIGATNTNMIVYDNNLPLINRNFEIGGETFKLTIANTLNISLERAEQIHNSYGLPINEQVANHPVSKAIKFTIDNMIIQEIKNLISVLDSQTSKHVSKIILTGGGCNLKGLPEYLENTLQIPTSIGDPWQKISYPHDLKPDLDAIAPEMSVAIGLALK